MAHVAVATASTAPPRGLELAGEWSHMLPGKIALRGVVKANHCIRVQDFSFGMQIPMQSHQVVGSPRPWLLSWLTPRIIQQTI